MPAFTLNAREREMTVCAITPQCLQEQAVSEVKRWELINSAIVSLVCDLSPEIWGYPEARDVKKLVRARVPAQRHRYARGSLPDFGGS